MNTIFNFSESDPHVSAKGVRQVINRKKYDTDTADCLWKKEYDREWKPGWGRYTHCGVALFRKKNGASTSSTMWSGIRMIMKGSIILLSPSSL